MTSRQHGALNVHKSVAGGVSTKQSCLMSIVNGESVAVSKSEVSVLVEDGSVTVSAALVVHGHPVGAILAVSNNSLRRSSRRAPRRLTIQESFSVVPDGEGHVSVTLHTSHALVRLVSSEAEGH